jgi:hypothetical protein
VIVGVVVVGVVVAMAIDRRTTDEARRQYDELQAELERAAEAADPEDVAAAAATASLGDHRPIDALAPRRHQRSATVDGTDLVLTYRIAEAPGGGCLQLRLSGVERSSHRVAAC